MQTERRLLFLLFLAFSLAVLSLPLFAQQVIATVGVGTEPTAAAVNSATNKTYVVNEFCPSSPCPSPGTVTVIDGVTDATTTVPVGVNPFAIAVNPVTNQIYVANNCGNDLDCSSPGHSNGHRRGHQ